MINVATNKCDDAWKIRLGKYLFYYSEWNLTASNSMLTARLKFKAVNFNELSAYDCNIYHHLLDRS